MISDRCLQTPWSPFARVFTPSQMESYLHTKLFKHLEISGFSGVIAEPWHHFNTILFSYDLDGSNVILQS